MPSSPVSSSPSSLFLRLRDQQKQLEGAPQACFVLSEASCLLLATIHLILFRALKGLEPKPQIGRCQTRPPPPLNTPQCGAASKES